MRFYLCLLVLFSHHQLISILFASSAIDNKHINQNNSTINIDLYQCNTNNTFLKNTISTNNRIFNNLINSCNVSCCTSNNSNITTSSNICQVTVQSSDHICLGRLCYSGGCNNFASLANITYDDKTKNKSTVMNTIHTSLGHIPWSSLVNSTQTKWTSWIDNMSSTIRHTMLYILLIASLSLTLLTFIVVIKSIRHATVISHRKSYRYTLL